MSTLPTTMFHGPRAPRGALALLGSQEYRRQSDDKIMVADDSTQLPCDGPDPCTYEALPQGDYVTVYPKNAPAQSSNQAPAQYVPTQVVATRSARDVLLEALALGVMGGGAALFGYGLGKPKTAAVIGGLVMVVAGAGLRVGVLFPWFVRAKDALLSPGMQKVSTTP